MEVIAVVAKHTTMNSESCTITAFFDTSTYLFYCSWKYHSIVL